MRRAHPYVNYGWRRPIFLRCKCFNETDKDNEKYDAKDKHNEKDKQRVYIGLLFLLSARAAELVKSCNPVLENME